MFIGHRRNGVLKLTLALQGLAQQAPTDSLCSSVVGTAACLWLLFRCNEPCGHGSRRGLSTGSVTPPRSLQPFQSMRVEKRLKSVGSPVRLRPKQRKQIYPKTGIKPELLTEPLTLLSSSLTSSLAPPPPPALTADCYHI